MNSILKYAKKKNSDQNEITQEDDQSTANCISINDININDIEENIITRNNNENNKKNDKKIEYYLFDVESYNNNSNDSTLNSIIDLNSIKSHYLPENKKKNVKKKASNYIKNHVQKYKKKYKILPEHNLDQDTNYEESVKNDNNDYDAYELKEIKNDKINNDFAPSQRKENYSKKGNSFIDFVFFAKIKSSTSLTRRQYIRYIVLISALLGLSSIAGNSSYSYLEIPVISVIKSSSLVLIYFLSIKFGEYIFYEIKLFACKNMIKTK
ncbi:phosphate translocator, putative [Plasmodium ovale curtisi]|uniref:Phosphate translocator, putative n=1 Tax=Plasmodium ovale curtisi TaxID=864141 RepID=A0A1A8WTQ9_PLAOA|nr:phosphate translocator, putative [Plasmodium ovale curtisi]